jgi:hypothetical protein
MKCRPRLYQKTRWLGVSNVLLSNKRAYDKGAYDGEIKCPIELETIEIYIQILQPAYFTTLGWEKNSASIADVIPQVLFLIDYWNKADIDDKEAKELCFFLIHYIKIKFEYELQAPMYLVSFCESFIFQKFSFIFILFSQAASVLRVSVLKNWIYRSYSNGYLKKGLEALKECCILFLYTSKTNNDNEETFNEQAQTQNSTNSNNNFASCNFYNHSQISENSSQSNEAQIFQRDKAIAEEIDTFATLLGNKKFVEECSKKKTSDVWKKYKNKMPILYQLKQVLLNIPATSSFIERFFSISGIVCDIRRLNMTDDLIIMRSLMKANMHILKDLNQISNINELIDN